MRITESSVYIAYTGCGSDGSIYPFRCDGANTTLDCASRTARALHCGIVFLFFLFVCLFVCQRDPPPRPQQRSLTLPRSPASSSFTVYCFKKCGNAAGLSLVEVYRYHAHAQ